MRKKRKNFEIIIITFNRNKDLNRTLNAIYKSELINNKITILDNYSTDNTEATVKNFTDKFQYLKYVKNTQNIGASANIMRAYEMASEDYIWIICDDDQYDFLNIENLYRVLDLEEPDVVVVGSPINIDQNNIFGKERINKIINGVNLSNKKLGLVLTFIPSAIIKVEKLKSCNFNEGYKLVGTEFPQFFWISEIFNKNWTVYILMNRLITRSNVDHGLQSNMDHINGYFEASKIIENKMIMEQVKYSYFDNSKKKYFISMVKLMMIDSVRGRLTLKNYIQHLSLINSSYLLPSLILVLIFIIPSSIIKKIITYKKYENTKDK
jgi:glycosyltransferase involved in cell wall biosynthesis